MIRLLLLVILLRVAPAPADLPASDQTAAEVGSNECEPAAHSPAVGCAMALPSAIRLKFLVSEARGLPDPAGGQIAFTEIPSPIIGPSFASRLPHPLRC